MEYDLITRISLGFLAAWFAAVLAHALASARDPSADPAAPVPPEEHHH